MFPTYLFALLALLSHESVASPAPDTASLAVNFNPLPWGPSLPRRDPKRDFTKRQGLSDGTAFDRNPDGSPFLWVLQDTYERETFFE